MKPNSLPFRVKTFETNLPPLLWTASRTLLGTGAIGFAIVAALNGGTAFQWEPVPDSWAIKPIFEWGSAAAMFFGGLLLSLNRRANVGAGMVALVMACWIVFLHVPRIFAGVEAAWLGMSECLTMGCGALVTAARPIRLTKRTRRRALRAISVVFGMTLIAFGAAHFIYAQITAEMVPDWLPDRLFWAYFTGVAHLAAGVSMISGLLQRWSSVLLGLMFSIFALLVNLPAALAQSVPMAAATGLAAAITLTGAAFAIAGESWDRQYR